LKLLAPGCSDSRDMAMRAGNGWKTLVRKDNGPQLDIHPEHDPTSVLIAQRDDLITLWENPNIQTILDKRRPRLQDSPGLLVLFYTNALIN
jgi:guanine nucleotide-binding protein alpha-1 subunit